MELPIYAYDPGGVTRLRAEVVGSESVADGAGGRATAWRVEGKAGAQTLRWWVSQADGTILKSAAVPAPGTEIVMAP